MLLLDEATSALDAAGEAAVQATLEVFMQGRTSLVVAHRLATVRRAHVIAVLREGVVAEAGSHEQLMAQGGWYRDMVAMQYGSPDVA